MKKLEMRYEIQYKDWEVWTRFCQRMWGWWHPVPCVNNQYQWSVRLFLSLIGFWLIPNAFRLYKCVCIPNSWWTGLKFNTLSESVISSTVCTINFDGDDQYMLIVNKMLLTIWWWCPISKDIEPWSVCAFSAIALINVCCWHVWVGVGCSMFKYMFWFVAIIGLVMDMVMIM